MCSIGASYNLRSRKILLKKRPHSESHSQVGKKRRRRFEYITFLPDEILLYIFSFLSIEELYFNVRPVCKRWRTAAMLAPSWRNIRVDGDVPTHILRNWVQSSSPLVRHFQMRNRNDADVVLNDLSKYCLRLESISLENCWGSTERVWLQSEPLCKLLVRCRSLAKMNFEMVKIRSCKFFQLLTKKRNQNGKFVQLSYVGPVNDNQYNKLRESCSGWIFTEYIEIV